MAMDVSGRRVVLHLEMPTTRSDGAMTALDGKEVGGRIEVNEARPRARRPASGQEFWGRAEDAGRAVDAARVAADRPFFETKITVSRRASRANRAGSYPFHGWAGRKARPSPHSAVRRGL